MAAVNLNEIELAYEAARRAHGDSPGLTAFATGLIESLISEQRNFKNAAERRTVEAEEALARILGADVDDAA